MSQPTIEINEVQQWTVDISNKDLLDLGLSVDVTKLITLEVPPAVTMELLTVGAQGPQGVTTFHNHSQAVASALWTVNHNLGRIPVAVRIKTLGGVEIEADVIDVSANQLTIAFKQSQAGSAAIF